MFEFWNDAFNYNERCVGKHEADSLLVSTVRVSDGNKPFETAVGHPDYNDGKLIIVEAYDAKGEAEAGHARWIEKMSAEVLPDVLQDCQNAGIAGWLDADDLRFERKPK